ncbi:regulator of G-protein signaling 19 [Trichinella spiralis]|uniref:regulator of G-protein signaling 19 n=1 Tax=Trichinella spiralis TaxID=6334 RepID=UPI0001EFE4AD|nr:regulator of G-protein signaling 19 [Trichinella spiralis]
MVAAGRLPSVDARRGRLLFLLNRRRQSRRRLRLTRPQLSTQLLRQHVELVRFDSVRRCRCYPCCCFCLFVCCCYCCCCGGGRRRPSYRHSGGRRCPPVPALLALVASATPPPQPPPNNH